MLIDCLVGGEVLLLLVGPRLVCHIAPRSGHWSRQYVVAAVAALHCYKSLYSLPPNSCPHHWSRTQPRKGIFDLRRTCWAGRQPQHHHVLPLCCSLRVQKNNHQDQDNAIDLQPNPRILLKLSPVGDISLTCGCRRTMTSYP